MILFQILAVLSALALVALFLKSLLHAPKARRKLYVVPGLFQLFAVLVALARGAVVPAFLPAEIITVFIYFFSLYLTYSAAISFSTSPRKVSALFSFAAIAYWILAIFA